MANYINISPGVAAVAATLIANNFAGTPLAWSPETSENYACGIRIIDGKFELGDESENFINYACINGEHAAAISVKHRGAQ